MKAVVQDVYGPPDVLELRDVDKPSIGDDEVLLRVHAAAVNPSDWHLMRGSPWVLRLAFGLRRPRNRVRGSDVAGTVEAAGQDVRELQPGNDVFGVCQGAFAEYATAKQDLVVPKPKDRSFAEAAAVPMAGLVALQALGKGEVQRDQRLLINGASGGVGTFAIQIAAARGAHVTAVCSSRNADMVRSIGAEHVIDYTEEDFTQSGERYDVILDNVANHSLSDCRRALTPKGILVPNAGDASFARVLGALIVSMFVSQKLRPFLLRESREGLLVLKELIESGTVKPVIDRTYELENVPEAIRYIEEGHARGKVVITVP